MALNPYFSFHGQRGSNANEVNLYKALQQECIQIRGYEFIYIPRTYVNIDYLFGEDLESKFESGFKFEAWIESFDGYGPGGPDLASKFGLEIKDEMKMKISKKTWDELKIAYPNCPNEPREGDLIFAAINRDVLEIKWVEDEDQFYPLGKQLTWELRVVSFDYGAQETKTGFQEVDDMEKQIPDDDFMAMLNNSAPQVVSAPVKTFDAGSPFGEF